MTTENRQYNLVDFSADLSTVNELIYSRCNFHFDEMVCEKESYEYAACSFRLNKKKIIYRSAKITPTKNGQFVTIWQRNRAGVTMPFNYTDDIDFIIISCRSGERLGQFVFPFTVLVQQKVVSGKDYVGKRGIRVYPPWDIPASKQALKTQYWQIKYFLLIEKGTADELALATFLLTE